MEIDRNYRRNAIGIMIDNSMFYIIALGLSQYTILPLYLSKLTNSKILIGLIPTIFVIGFSLPQIFTARFLKGKSKKKKYLVGVAVAQRVSILTFLILTLVQRHLSANLTIFLFFLIFSIQNIITGCWYPMWVDFIGRAIPRNRGKIFGFSCLLGGLLGFASGSLITYFLDSLPYPYAISAAAAIAFMASMISLIAIISWREVVPPEPEKNEEQTKIDSHFLSTIKNNKNFQRYLLWRGTIIGIEMALPYLTISALDRLYVADSQIGIFAIILGLSQSIMNMIWGWLGDNIGYLKILIFSTILGCLGCVMLADGLSIGIFYFAFLCLGAMLGGQQQANINIIYEFNKSGDNVPTYAAIQQTILSPISSLMPVIGGIILNRYGYSILFWTASIIGIGGVVGVYSKVNNPKHE